jgi:hypothetical protein
MACPRTRLAIDVVEPGNTGSHAQDRTEEHFEGADMGGRTLLSEQAQARAYEVLMMHMRDQKAHLSNMGTLTNHTPLQKLKVDKNFENYYLRYVDPGCTRNTGTWSPVGLHRLRVFFSVAFTVTAGKK